MLRVRCAFDFTKPIDEYVFQRVKIGIAKGNPASFSTFEIVSLIELSSLDGGVGIGMAQNLRATAGI